MMVSIRLGAMPRSAASWTYSGPCRSMKASIPSGAWARSRSASPSPYSTGTAPWAVSQSAFAADAIPSTRAPRWTSNWVSTRPTPPAAADTATTSPRVAPAARAAAYAVTPMTYSDPATSHDIPAGLPMSWFAGTAVWVAWLDRVQE